MTSRDLYGVDFLEWTRCNAALLRAGRLDEIDAEHLAEEIEDMGVNQRHQLFSRLKVVMMHLLRWQAEPGRRSASWRRIINTQRDRLELLLEDAPSLKSHACARMQRPHEKAVRDAMVDTGLPEASFPETCPFTIDQILDEKFFPD
jgi:hypothetical protein